MGHRATRLATAALLLLASARPAGAQGTVARPDLYRKTLEFTREVLKRYGEYENREELARVNRIGYQLVQQARFEDYPFTFFLVDMPVPNAFALPGGQIFVTRGMLDLGLSDAMLANLLGHEIAHVVREHGLRMQKRATLLNILSQALLVGVMIGSKGDRRDRDYDPYGLVRERDPGGSKVEGAMAASLVLGELLLRSYSREFEDEADDEGQRLAAAAGHNPLGATELWSLMMARVPRAKEYGYWQTHPFADERMRAAQVRGDLLKIQEPRSADDLRRRTQARLLAYLEKDNSDPELVPVLEQSILTAWPEGPVAERLRAKQLHELRDGVLGKPSFSRDFGKVLAAYRRQAEEVRSLTPDSPLLATLDQERADLEEQARRLYQEAREILAGEVYETSFLETFLSNYPDAPEVPAVALALGDAYSRLRDPARAVRQYLKVCQLAPDSPEGKKARQGLRNLAPYLEQLSALQELAGQEDDPELVRLAEDRLSQMAGRYEEAANGAEYLKRFPDGTFAEVVEARLNTLADRLMTEVVLYQGLGDHVKALERINQILTHAPFSPAAERLREQAVFEG